MRAGEFFTLRGYLPVLPVAALEPDLPAAALRRHFARPARAAACAVDAEFLVAARRLRGGLCLRLGRAFLLREEPPRHLHPPALQLHGRLGDVEGHHHWKDQALTFGALLSSELPWLTLLALVLTGVLLHARPPRAQGVPEHAVAVPLRRARPGRGGGGPRARLPGGRGGGAHGVPHRRRDRAHPPARLRRIPPAAAARRAHAAAHRRGPDDHRGLRHLRPDAAARRRRRPHQHRRHLGGDHRGARLRHAGHARQHARRPGAAARQLGAGRRLDPRRRPGRPGARHPLALDADRDAQLGDGGDPEQHADEGPRRPARPARGLAAAAAPRRSSSRSTPACRRRASSPPSTTRCARSAIPNVARAPASSCILLNFEDGNLRYRLRYFLTNLLEDDLTDSMVRVHLFASLQRADIRIAEPQRTVHAVQRDEAHAATVRRRELTRRLEMLRGVDMFAELSDEEKARDRRAPAVRAVRARRHHHQAGRRLALAVHRRLRRGRGAVRAARQRAARRRHAARRPVLRRDGTARRRGALRHRDREDRRRVLPPGQGRLPGPAAVAARASPRK